jgi:hypothetical protein
MGLALAVLALGLVLSAYRYEVQRDEQARGIALRLERGELDLAERHRRAVAVLGKLADALRELTFYAAGAAIAAGAWGARRPRTNLWLTGATVVLAVGGIVLALESRDEQRAATDLYLRGGRAVQR